MKDYAIVIVLGISGMGGNLRRVEGNSQRLWNCIIKLKINRFNIKKIMNCSAGILESRKKCV